MRCSIRLAALVAGFVLALSSCNEQAAVSQNLQIFFTCDLYGRLQPCGCFDGQHGGLARIARYVERNGISDALLLDVGNAAQGSEDYHQIQYRYVLQAFGKLDYQGLNPGHREIAFGLENLRQLVQETSAPMVSANLVESASGKRVFPPYRIIQQDAYKLAIVGVTEPKEASAGEGLRLEDPEIALSEVLPEAAEKSDFVILLAFATGPKLQELAERFYEVDILLGGDVPQPSQDLERINRSYLVKTTNEGRALGKFFGVMKGPGVLEGTLGEAVLMNTGLPQDPEILAFTNLYQDKIRETTLAIDDPNRVDDNAIPGVAQPARYVGSASCVSCHSETYKKWEKSGHAHAFDSLVYANADADPSCISCHSVGFGEPSGYRREFGKERLVHVGCESCHGPGSEHIAQRAAGGEVTFRYRHLGAGDCVQCHQGEFSRPFKWETWWPRIEH